MRDNLQAVPHPIVLGVHIGEAHAAGLDLDEDLALGGRDHGQLLEDEGLALGQEGGALVGGWERHYFPLLSVIRDWG
jgi:hypothetical protein